MILTYGDSSKIASLNRTHWYMVELRSEKTVESTLKRLGTQLPSIFDKTAVEIFVPVFRRDIDVFELKTGNYIFARSKYFHGLLRLKTVTGVVGLVTKGDTNHPSKAIKVEDQYVQQIIVEAEDFFRERTRAITMGSFVRIIDGEQRNYCGTVVEMTPQEAVVRVDIKTKIILVETPLANLLNLSDVPVHMRVFYYAPVVESLQHTQQDDLVAEDLVFREDAAHADDGLDVQPSKRHGRQQTVTALVKRLILTGTLEPNKIAIKVVEALKDGRLKQPKNLSIVHGIIKSRLIADHFQRKNPRIVNYREVIAQFGQRWKFPLHELVELAAELSLPISSSDEEKSDD